MKIEDSQVLQPETSAATPSGVVLADDQILQPKPYAEAGHRIVCSAMRFSSGLVIPSVRHYDPLTHGLLGALNAHDTSEQGFVDNKFNFLTREEAWPVAVNAGQIIRRCGGDTVYPELGSPYGRLYSENLY